MLTPCIQKFSCTLIGGFPVLNNQNIFIVSFCSIVRPVVRTRYYNMIVNNTVFPMHDSTSVCFNCFMVNLPKFNTMFTVYSIVVCYNFHINTSLSFGLENSQ